MDFKVCQVRSFEMRDWNRSSCVEVEIQVQNVKDSKGEMLENNSEMLPLLLKLVVADQFRIQSEKHRKMSYKLKKL
jgi:hypothetical protein